MPANTQDIIARLEGGRCETCKHWDRAQACPAAQKLRTRRDADYETIVPPHADLRWSVCGAALMGFENDTVAEEAELFGGKMAVFDGSAYMAELWTRFDHVCSQYAALLRSEGE